MEIRRLVTGAKLGNNDDYAALVRLFQDRLTSWLRGLVRDAALAEELAQESFVKAWSALGGLRRAEAFPSWLWGIARNEALGALRRRKRESGQLEQADMDSHASPWGRPDMENPPPGWNDLVAGLSPDGRLLLELRHVAGLSLRQIGLLTGVPEQRVKSRLFEARRRLARQLTPDGRPTGQTKNHHVFLEERIMDRIQTLRLGAWVFERLALADQVDFAKAVLDGQELDDGLLAALGRVDRGAEFIGRYGKRLELREFIGIVNHCDRFTEARMVEQMERSAPAQAELFKQNCFVFEDLLLFDPSALRALVPRCDPDILGCALAGTERRVREHILAPLDTAVRQDLAARSAAADSGPAMVRSAQETIVGIIMDMEAAGALVVRRGGATPDGNVVVIALS
jgi:RNA polymerase sigma-70 factor (ECF subfamily)